MRSIILLKEYDFIKKSLSILIIIVLAGFLFPNGASEQRHFDVKEFQENFSIPRNDIRTIDFTFQEGKKLEIIYTIQVEGELPIDIWFINEDNYLLLTNGAQFLYYIGGTEQKISYAKKVVTLTENDNYKLVMTNYYNNQTIEVNVIGEMRTFENNTEENSLNFSQIFIYLLIVISIIFIIITIFLSLKLHRSNRVEVIESNKNSTKKINSSKPKKNRSKNKNKDSGRRAKNKKSKNTIKETKTSSNSSDYCGYCGESVSTPFCKHCGREV